MPQNKNILMICPTDLNSTGGAQTHIINVYKALTILGYKCAVVQMPPEGIKQGFKGTFATMAMPRSIEGYPTFDKYLCVISFDLAGFGVEHPNHMRVLTGSYHAYRNTLYKKRSHKLNVFSNIRWLLVSKVYDFLEKSCSNGLGSIPCSIGLQQELLKTETGKYILGSFRHQDSVIYPPNFSQEKYLAKGETLNISENSILRKYKQKTFLYCGRVEESKGVKEFNKIAREFPDWKWIFITPTSKEDVIKLLGSDIDSENKIIYWGKIDPTKVDELNDWYQKATLVLLPSWFEGSSMVPIEAAMNATPCLTSYTGQGVDYSMSEEAEIQGLVNKDQDWGEFVVEYINENVSDPVKYKKLCYKIQSKMNSKFGLAVAIEQWKKLLLKLENS